jgi:hypothetical protein
METAGAVIIDRLRSQYKAPIPARLLEGLLASCKGPHSKVLSFLLASQPGVEDEQFLSAIVSKGFEIDQGLVEIVVGDSPVQGRIVICCGVDPSHVPIDRTIIRTYSLLDLRQEPSKKRLFWEEVKKVKLSLLGGLLGVESE